MPLKFHVSHGLNEDRHFKISFLCSAVYDTVALTNSLNYTVYISDTAVNINCKCAVVLICVNFVLALQLVLCC